MNGALHKAIGADKSPNALVREAADDEIRECLNQGLSFYLIAGAGSGKTRSLVTALEYLVESRRVELVRSGQAIAVITYTNAATEEIRRRLRFSPLVQVSTIHSFAWSLIEGFDDDIRQCRKEQLSKKIDELKAEIANGTAKTRPKKEEELARKVADLAVLDDVVQFTYSPSSVRPGRSSLGHSEVIAFAALLLRRKPGLRTLMTARHPVLFIDECQDTNAAFANAIFEVEKLAPGFVVGLFGDSMQRIYLDGEKELDAKVRTWCRPEKRTNYRSVPRLVELCNKVRALGEANPHTQVAARERASGIAHVFAVPRVRARTEGVDCIEDAVRRKMSDRTAQHGWKTPITLILEHRMAARRGGFLDLFETFDPKGSLRDTMLRGEGRELAWLRNLLALVQAIRADDASLTYDLLVQHASVFQSTFPGPPGAVVDTEESWERRRIVARRGVDALRAATAPGQTPLIGDVVRAAVDGHLLLPTDPVRDALVHLDDPGREGAQVHEELEPKASWFARACGVAWSEFEAFDAYVREAAGFATHQGVKGLEFPHVLVVIDDAEAVGRTYGYEKLLASEVARSEEPIARTIRLLYVVCSRARDSLALVWYTDDVSKLASWLVRTGLFSAEEVTECAAEGELFISS